MRRRAMLLLVAMGAALVLSSGIALAVTRQCKDFTVCYGTKYRDTLLGTDNANQMYAKGSADRLYGFAQQDEMHGQGGSDKLFGNTGQDNLYPGPGNDVSDGGDAYDQYYFETDKWGKDTITDTLNNTLPVGNEVIFSESLTNGLTIKLASDPLSPEVTDAAGTSTINWSDNAIPNIKNYASGSDSITGNDFVNNIRSEGELDQDQVFAQGGNDFIWVADGGGRDNVDCGDGTDTVYYDTLDPGFPASRLDTATNCEDLHPQ